MMNPPRINLFPVRRSRRSGFTMIELIVVSVLMVVLAAVIVPRIVGGETRRARATVEAIRDLLTAAGDREAMTSQPVTLAFDSGASGGGRLSLLSGAALGRALSTDPLVPPVALNGLELERCTAGAIVLNKSRWQVPLREGDRRPSVTLLLRQPGDTAWIVELSSEAGSATLAEADSADQPAMVQGAIDLDQTGRGEDPW